MKALIVVALVAVACAGCNGTKPTPPITPAVPEVPVAPTPKAEIVSPPPTVKPEVVLAGPSAEEVEEISRREIKRIETELRKREVERRKSERLSLLSEKEKQRLELAREILKSGRGLWLSPNLFLFVWDQDNAVLLEEEIYEAAKVTCGPLIDSIHESYGLSVDEKLSLRYKFDLNWFPVNKEIPEAFLFREENPSTSQLRRRWENADSIGSGSTDELASFPVERLAILGKVMSGRRRVLSDNEIEFLREFQFAKDELRDYLASGPKAVPKPKRVAREDTRTADEVSLAQSLLSRWADLPQYDDRIEKIRVARDAKDPKTIEAIAKIRAAKLAVEESITADLLKYLGDSVKDGTWLDRLDLLFFEYPSDARRAQRIIRDLPMP